MGTIDSKSEVDSQFGLRSLSVPRLSRSLRG